MNYYNKLLFYFGGGLLFTWVLGLLANGIPTSQDYIVLNIIVPIVGVISLIIAYIWYK